MREQELLNLQLFADEDIEENPVEETENDNPSNQEEGEEPEFEDSENTNENEEEQKTTEEEKQKEKNRKFAQERIRRKKELEDKKRKEEQESYKKNGYVEGIKKATKGKNPYNDTHNLTDEFDIEIYNMQQELEAQGKDPVEDLPAYIAQKRREERQKQIENERTENERSQRISDEIKSFNEKYGEETAKKIFEDDEFIDFSDGLLGNVPLNVVYEKFLGQKAKSEAKAKDLALEKDARRKSSTGPTAKGNNEYSSILSMDSKDLAELSRQIAKRY